MFSVAHAQEATTQLTVNMNAWDAIVAASPIVQATLALLVFMSLASWAIVLTKKRTFGKVSFEDEIFLDVFWKGSSLEAINEKVDRFPASSVARVFKAGYNELQRMAADNGNSEDEEEPRLHGADNIDRALHRAIDREVLTLEKRLSFLATTGSTAPFIGLFGTVWGIMGSFQKIGAMKSASLAVVAPGISEALVATAVGLAAAIPAVMAYNHYLTRLRRCENTLNGFAADYLNLVKRNFFKDK